MKFNERLVARLKYDFETLVNRHGTGSAKYEQMMRWNPQVTEDIIPYSVADMEFKTPPEIVEGLKAYLDTHILGYTIHTPEYLQAVMKWMKKRHDWEIRKEWILAVPGVVGAFYMAVRALTEPGEGVIVMTPVYYPFYDAVKSAGRNLVENPLVERNGRFEIDFDDLERKAADPKTTALLFCSPHNPVGRVWTVPELQQVVQICEKHHVKIFSDEIHFDLIMPGYTHTVLAKISAEAAKHMVIFTAPSKTFNLAGLHVSNVVIPDVSLRSRFRKEMASQAIMNINALGYEACRLAYEEGEPWLEELIQVIKGNHEVLRDYMEEHHPEVRVYPLEGTYLQWMDFRPLGISKEDLEKLMHKKALVFFDEGYVFGNGGEGFERMNLACPRWVLLEGLKRMTKTLREREETAF